MISHMLKDSHMIGEKMLQAVNGYFLVQDLKKYLSGFVEYKMQDDFPFGKIAILHYRMFGGKSEHIYQAAAAIELMILALDIFDDLQDQDNCAIPWCKIESAISMNIATGLLLLSAKTLEGSSFDFDFKATALNYLNEQVLKAVNGQHIDLCNLIESEEEFISMVKQKSGALLVCACLVGTALATKNNHEYVKQYAEHIGVAAQIKNDSKDLLRWNEKNDFIRKKKTLPILYLIQYQRSEFQIIRDYYGGKVQKEEFIDNKNRLEELINKSGAFEYASVIMRVNQLQAMEQIKAMNVAEEWKVKLIEYI